MIHRDTLICYNIWPLFADHVLDYPEEYYIQNGVKRLHNVNEFVPENVKENDIVFVKTDFIVHGTFYNHYFERIKNKFNLVTANSAYQIGSMGDVSYKHILESGKLIRWFCTNPINVNDDKIIPIPIGFEEQNRESGNQMILNSARNKRKYFWNKQFKSLLPYHNFDTNPERKRIYESLSGLKFVDAIKEKQSPVEYLRTLDKYRFVLCIEGSGNDLHRIYEVLLCGAIPIIKDSSIRRIVEFYKLPVLIIDSWDKLDETTIEFMRAFPSKFDNLFKNVEKFLYAKNYKKLFLNGEW